MQFGLRGEVLKRGVWGLREFSGSIMALKVYAGSSNKMHRKPAHGATGYAGRPKKNEFTLSTGSDRDKKWAKIVITKAYKANAGQVELIREGQVVKCGIKECFKGLDLRTQGIVVVGESKECMKLKVVDHEQAMKAYSDHLAKHVTEALRASDNSVVRKQDKNNRKEDTFKGKVVQVGWGITMNDLRGQKCFEVERHLAKGFDVDIVFDERRNLDKENVGGNAQVRRCQLEEVEALRREKILDLLQSHLETLGAKFSRDGAIDSRLVISAKALQRAAPSKEEKRAAKATEKALRREKLAARAERKHQSCT